MTAPETFIAHPNLQEPPGRGIAVGIRAPLASGPRAEALAILVAKLKERFGEATVAVLGYGSLLRDGLDLDDGIFDFLVVVDGYRRAYRGLGLAALNFLLPPNVFYLEAALGDRCLRAKYAVVSVSQLRRLTAPSRLQCWFWGRLAQPVMVAHARDAAAAEAISEIVKQSIACFLRAVAPLMASPFTARAIWQRGLEECLRTEFRPEGPARAKALADRDAPDYEIAAGAVSADLAWIRTIDEAGAVGFRAPGTGSGRRRARAAWYLRRIEGRMLHVLRLMKAAFTFSGGIDYLAWKIERHSGVRVEVSPRARRHPLLFGWWALWKFRRKGGFR